MQVSRAFSLVELLVVVAIVAILAALAVPVYNTYLIKSRITELLAVADNYKIKIIENYIAERESNINDNIDSNYIERITAYSVSGEPFQHAIDVVAKMRTEDHLGIGLLQPLDAPGPLTIQLRGVQNNEIISWTCNVDQAYAKYVPHICNNNHH